jgi:aryl-alcohol dehydrogenase-like predicted oxidoreductase
VSRREFLERSGLAVGAVAALPALPPRVPADATVTTTLPHRTLGRTGASVSILAMGCGSRFLMYPADEATAVLEKAVGLGIDYLDTAVGYGEGESETRLGRFLATRRKDVFLATKVPGRSRTRDAALKEVEASLKRLQTDHLDLLHLHSLGDEADLAKIEAPDGAIKALYELREQKVTRFIGMTGHTDGAVMAKAIEHNDLDCVQMAMNPARAARFEELACRPPTRRTSA